MNTEIVWEKLKLLKKIDRKKNTFSHQLKKDRLLKEQLVISFEIIFVIFYVDVYIFYSMFEMTNLTICMSE